MSAVLGSLSQGYRRLRIILEMIKFEHTVFALPFALIGMIYAANGLPSASTVLWIVLAMVGARSAAMAFNRIADRYIDAQNPRTKNRALPAGQLTATQVGLFMVAAVALFELASWNLNPLCAWLSPVALFVVLGYSYAKRFTALAHVWLGAALGIAPTAAWIAVTGRIDPEPLLLSAGVMLWTAGFDVLYSLQDLEFDRSFGLHSIPNRFGKTAAFRFARGFHAAAVLSFALAGVALGAGPWFFVGVAVVAALLAYEHTLVNPNDLSRINMAFFTVNGYVSVAMLLFVLIDRFAQGRG